MQSTLARGLVALTAAGLLTTAASPANAERSLGDQEQLVINALSGHEYKPARLDRIGPEVDRILVRVADRTAVRPTIRARALATLSLYPTARTQRYLEALLYDRDVAASPEGMILRRQALRSLGTAFGEGALQVLSNFKDSTEAQLREACAHAYGDSRAPQARQILASWLPVESELFVREAIERSSERLRKAIPKQ